MPLNRLSGCRHSSSSSVGAPVPARGFSGNSVAALGSSRKLSRQKKSRGYYHPRLPFATRSGSPLLARLTVYVHAAPVVYAKRERQAGQSWHLCWFLTLRTRIIGILAQPLARVVGVAVRRLHPGRHYPKVFDVRRTLRLGIKTLRAA
jgi:hypothetical protein